MLLRHHRPRRLRPEARLLAAGLALILLLAPVGDLAHLLRVRHQVCTEHGEFVHAPMSDRNHAARAPASGEASIYASSAASAAAHDHGCAILAHLRSAFRPVSGNACAISCPPAGCLLQAWAPACEPSPRPVLQYAPKNSPPDVELA